MSASAWLLLSWILVGAAILVAHAYVLFAALRASALPVSWRLAALVPPLAPVAAWRAGKRVGPIAWLVLVLAYLVLRALERA